jgi:hypothetical protein
MRDHKHKQYKWERKWREKMEIEKKRAAAIEKNKESRRINLAMKRHNTYDADSLLYCEELGGRAEPVYFDVTDVPGDKLLLTGSKYDADGKCGQHVWWDDTMALEQEIASVIRNENKSFLDKYTSYSEPSVSDIVTVLKTRVGEIFTRQTFEAMICNEVRKRMNVTPNKKSMLRDLKKRYDFLCSHLTQDVVDTHLSK